MGINYKKAHLAIYGCNFQKRWKLLFFFFFSFSAYLTIGIPTVKRKGADYLEKTLETITKNTVKADWKDITVVVFLTDTDHHWIVNRAKEVYQKFTQQVDDGLIQIVHPHHNSYPNFTKLERKFNDSRDRVAWRSKQNLDYSYLLTYSQNISKYYMQIEDDVIVAPTYFRDIRKNLENRKDQKWFVISFSRLGFIGKLFRSKDLSILADFLLMFFDEKPCDILLNDIRLIKGQRRDINVRPSLFQHIGIISSLKDKKQLLVDKGFKGKDLYKNRKKFYHDNPPAFLDTNMEIYEEYDPEGAYNASNGYFWAMSPAKGTFFRILFEKPQNISRLYIKCGLRDHPQDTFKVAKVNVSPYQADQEARCHKPKFLGPIAGEAFDTKSLKVDVLRNAGCISIDVTQDHKNWIIIHEIAIFT